MHPIQHNNLVTGTTKRPADEGPPLPAFWRRVTSVQRLTRWQRTALKRGSVLLVLGAILSVQLTACSQSSTQGAHPGSAPTATPRMVSGATSTALPIPRTQAIKPLAWSNHSVSMTVVNDVAYAATTDQTVYALRSLDGALIWRTRIEGAIDQAPVVANGVVYSSSYVGQSGPASLLALRASDGTVKWRYSNTAYILQSVVYNNVVYTSIQQDGVIALRASDGVRLWHFASPTVQEIFVDHGILYMSSGLDGFYALRATDGKMLWHDAPGTQANTSIVQNGVVFALSENNVSALRATDGHQLWSQKIDATFYQPPQISNGILYLLGTKMLLEPPTPTANSAGLAPILANVSASFWNNAQTSHNGAKAFLKQGKSSVYALRASDGRLLWQDLVNQGQDSFATWMQVEQATVYTSTVASTGESNTSTIAALRGNDGTVIWQHTTSGTISQEQIADGTLYIGVDSTAKSAVYALQTLDGRVIWSYPIAGDILNGLVLREKTVYIGASNGIAYVLRSANGNLVWYYRTAIEGTP